MEVAPMKEQILVLGAGYAGLMAALRTAKQTRGRAEVTLVSAEDTFCERIRLHQLAAGAQLERRPLQPLLAGMDVRFRKGMVRELRPAAGEVLMDGERLGYDRLIYALGSQVDVASVPGVREHAYTLDAASARRLSMALPDVASRGGHLLVVGGGLTGIEAASELAEAFPALRVTLLCQGELATMLSTRGQAYIRRALAQKGVALHEHTAVHAIEPGVAHSGPGGQTPFGFDLCLWAGGFVALPLGREAGLAVNERGQILVDPWLRALSQPAIYVAGDAAAPAESVGAPILMACKTAMPLGAHAANNVSRALLGRPEERFGFGDTGVCISLGRRDALIQIMSRDGQPTNTIITGRLGAWLKERVCRYTVTMLRGERHNWWSYRWRSAPATMPARAEGEAATPPRLAA
jgi:NADH dehydrogenase